MQFYFHEQIQTTLWHRQEDRSKDCRLWQAREWDLMAESRQAAHQKWTVQVPERQKPIGTRKVWIWQRADDAWLRQIVEQSWPPQTKPNGQPARFIRWHTSPLTLVESPNKVPKSKLCIWNPSRWCKTAGPKNICPIPGCPCTSILGRNVLNLSRAIPM